MLKKIFGAISATLILTASAFAQGPAGPGGGPGPIPNPWIVSGPTISYNNGGATLPQSVTGGSKGVGTFNVSGGYYINGVSISTVVCGNCAFTNVANVFTASPQTVQGLTTTSPGWYAQITGDTFARVRVGLNATDVPSIAFGPGNAVRDAFIERVGAGQLRFGAPDAASPIAQISSVQNVVTGTLNTAGADRTYYGSRGTGNAVGGAIIFQTAPAGGSGTSQNALVTAAKIFGTGGVVLSSAIGGDKGLGALNATGLYINGTAVSLTAGGITVGTSTITSGANTRVLFDNSGVLGEYTISGSGSVAMTTSPSLTTPSLGVATGTSLALGGGSIGSDALEVTGTTTFNGAVSVVGASLSLSGNQSLAAWTTNGVKLKGIASTLTDTTSSGTVATAYTSVLGGNTIAASNATTFTNYYGLYVKAPVTGSNVTFSNSYALGADSLNATTIALNGSNLAGANPSATAGASAVNGSAVTYMRSDAAPAIQKGTNAQFGIVEGDGTTITCVVGVCTAVGAAATSVDAGGTTTTVSNGTTGYLLQITGTSPLYLNKVPATFDSITNAAPVDALASVNTIINGDNIVSQENGTTNVTGITNQTKYISDQWTVRLSAFRTVSAQVVSDAPSQMGISSSLKVTMPASTASPGAADFMAIEQPIEGYRILKYAFGQSGSNTATIGTWIKSSITGTNTYSIYLKSSGADRTYLSQCSAAANTWTYCSFNVSAQTGGTWGATSNVGAYVGVTLSAGTNSQGTNAAWNTSTCNGTGNCYGVSGDVNVAGTASATFQITSFFMVPGSYSISSSRSAFMMRPYAESLQLAQRYYAKDASINVAFYIGASDSIFWSYTFPVEMRSGPTTAITGGSYSAAGVSLAFNSCTTHSCTENLTADALAGVLRRYAVGWTLTLDARM